MRGHGRHPSPTLKEERVHGIHAMVRAVTSELHPFIQFLQTQNVHLVRIKASSQRDSNLAVKGNTEEGSMASTVIVSIDHVS